MRNERKRVTNNDKEYRCVGMFKRFSYPVLVLSLVLSGVAGCSHLKTFASLVTPSSGISVDAQLGDKKLSAIGKTSARDIVLDDGGTVKIDSRTINTGISPWWLLTGFIFWQLPKLTESISAWRKNRTKDK